MLQNMRPRTCEACIAIHGNLPRLGKSRVSCSVLGLPLKLVQPLPCITPRSSNLWLVSALRQSLLLEMQSCSSGRRPATAIMTRTSVARRATAMLPPLQPLPPPRRPPPPDERTLSRCHGLWRRVRAAATLTADVRTMKRQSPSRSRT
jgi:hypothetical protein